MQLKVFMGQYSSSSLQGCCTPMGATKLPFGQLIFGDITWNFLVSNVGDSWEKKVVWLTISLNMTLFMTIPLVMKASYESTLGRVL